MRRTRRKVEVLVVAAALLVTAPAVLWLDQDFGHRETGARFATHFDFESLVDLQNARADQIATYSVWVDIAIIAFLLVQVFLKGGIIALLDLREEPFGIDRFLGACGRYFLRFVRLLVWLVVGLVVLYFVNRWTAAWLTSAYAGESAGSIVDALLIGRAAFMLLLLIGLAAVMTFASIGAVVDRDGLMIRQTARALALCFRNPLRVGTLILLSLVLPVGASVGYGYLVQTQIDTRTPVWITLAWTQALLLIWSFCRVHGYAAQMWLRRQIVASPDSETDLEEEVGYPQLEREELSSV